MGVVDPAKLLSYGAIGLGFLLAFLSYLLLASEQKLPVPRREMIHSIYTFMVFAFLLSCVGFGNELFKQRISPLRSKDDFTSFTPMPKSPGSGSQFSQYPRDLELMWDAVPDAVAYLVESQIQIEIEGQHRVEWVSLPDQTVTPNRCQIEFGGATWGRWRVTAIDQTGKRSHESEWQTFEFTR